MKMGLVVRRNDGVIFGGWGLGNMYCNLFLSFEGVEHPQNGLYIDPSNNLRFKKRFTGRCHVR
jgi:hypothetical protein